MTSSTISSSGKIPRSMLKCARWASETSRASSEVSTLLDRPLLAALWTGPRHRHSTPLRKPIRFGHSAPQHHRYHRAQPNRCSLRARSDDVGQPAITSRDMSPLTRGHRTPRPRSLLIAGSSQAYHRQTSILLCASSPPRPLFSMS
jgi:hypothetical protein